MRQLILLLLLTVNSLVYSQTPEIDWVAQVASTGSENEFYSLATTDEGYVYGLLGFKGTPWTMTYWGPTSAGKMDIGIAKFNRYGKCLWVKRVGGKENDQGERLKLLSNGSLLIVGRFKDTADFNPSTTAQEIRISNGGEDCFALLLDGDGNYQNCKTFGGYQDDVLFAIDEGSNQSIWISGRFIDSIDLDPQGISDIHLAPNGQGSFILQMDNQLNSLNSLSIHAKDYATIYDLDVSRSGYVHYVAYFDDTLTCAYNDTTIQIVSNGLVDCYYSIMDLEGNYVDQLHIGSPYFELAYGLTEMRDGKYVMQVMYEDSLPLTINGELQYIYGKNSLANSNDHVRNTAIVKLNGTTVDWCKAINSIYTGGYIFLAADPAIDEFDNIYFAAQYTTACSINQPNFGLIGQDDNKGALLVKLSPDGIAEGLYTINGSGGMRPFCIHIVDRTLYLAGKTSGSNNDFDFTEATYWVSEDRAVIAKYLLEDPFLATDILENETDRIYPNPANEILIVPTIDAQNLRVFDLSGREIPVEQESNGTATTINTSALSEGTYLVSYTLNGEFVSQRFVVQH